MEYSQIGRRVARLDGQAKATGRAVYIDDMSLPRMLKCKILKSPLPHARILNIDVSRAERLPGVKAVITSKELPETVGGIFLKDMPVLARGKVRFVSEPVVAVAATDDDIGEEALSLIQVDYEELPAVFDPVEAMQPGAPIIHEELQSYFATFSARRHGNVCSHTTFCAGDIEAGFKEAEEIFEDQFRTQPVHQGYMEPSGAIASVEPSGKVTVWASTQCPHLCQIKLAEILMIPINKLRIVSTQVGGGFGGKEDMYFMPIIIALAQKSGRPVKMVLSREEEFLTMRSRHASLVRVKTGAKRDGQLTARQVTVIMGTGAYSDHGPGVLGFATMMGRGPYRIPNYLLEGYCVYTNMPISGAYRGYGNPQVTFALESHLDIIAQSLGIDPLELRLKNLVNKGDLQVDGQPLLSVGLRECLEKASRAAGWGRPRERGRGKGLAVMQHISGLLSSSALVRLNEDGTVTVSTGAVDIGTGSETVLAQIAAEELGVTLSDVTMVMGDTDSTPYNWSTAGSRTTYVAGTAVKQAAADVRRQIVEMAAAELEASPADMELKERRIFVTGAPDRGLTLRQMGLLSHWRRGGPIIGKSSFMVEGPLPDPKRVMGFPFAYVTAFSYGAHVVEVEADEATGQVKVVNLWAAHDVGKAINPSNVEGQIQGAFAQGLGYALCEEMVIEQGRVVNPNLADYRLPAAPDLPSHMEAIIVEEPEPTGPFGAKGVGEPGLVPSAPAIANALFSALGARVKELPITPERVLAALREVN